VFFGKCVRALADCEWRTAAAGLKPLRWPRARMSTWLLPPPLSRYAQVTVARTTSTTTTCPPCAFWCLWAERCLSDPTGGWPSTPRPSGLRSHQSRAQSLVGLLMVWSTHFLTFHYASPARAPFLSVCVWLSACLSACLSSYRPVFLPLSHSLSHTHAHARKSLFLTRMFAPFLLLSLSQVSLTHKLYLARSRVCCLVCCLVCR